MQWCLGVTSTGFTSTVFTPTGYTYTGITSTGNTSTGNTPTYLVGVLPVFTYWRATFILGVLPFLLLTGNISIICRTIACYLRETGIT